MRSRAGCHAWEPLIAAHVDGEATPEEGRALEAHARTCGRCAEQLERQPRLAPRLARELRAAMDRAPLGAVRATPRPAGRLPGALASAARIALTAAVLLVLLGGTAILLRVQQRSSQLPQSAGPTGPGTTGSPASSAPSASFVAYGRGTLDAGPSGEIVALELPSGRALGRYGDVRRQGGGLAVAPDGRRAYLLDGPFFHELELPSLRELRSADLPNPINILGTGRVVVVSPDGRQVYVETTRIVGPNRWDPQLQHGQPDSEYGIAVYDVAQGAFVREITLDPPWCGVAELFALPDGRLAVLCSTALELRLVDPNAARQLATIGVYGANGAASPDGRRLWVVVGTGQLQEVDLDRQVVARSANLAGDPGRCAPSCVPGQRLQLSGDGTRLFVRAAPDHPEQRATGHGTVVWVVDTATLQRVAEVPLPAPARDAVPGPDGTTVIASTAVTQHPDTRATWLLEVPTGRQLARWPGALYGLQAPAAVAAPTAPAAPPVAVPSPEITLAALRQELPFPVFVPTRLPAGLRPEPTVAAAVGTPGVRLVYRAADGTEALSVLDGPAGCCLDADPRKTGEPVSLPRGASAHFLGLQPNVGGPILWWVQEGAYVALSGPRLDQEQLVNVAGSMSRTAVPPLAGGPPVSADTTPDAAAALERFMRARIQREDRVVLDLLTDDLRARQGGISATLTQSSNPCWYQYQVLALDQPTPTSATARVRVWMHHWSGDNGGTLPRSREQEIGLAHTPSGWRVDRLSEWQSTRDEPDEPHAWTVSACTVARGWSSYSSSTFRVSLRHPPAWAPNPGYPWPNERLEGPRGFFQVAALAGEASPDETARSQADQEPRPFGSQPRIEPLRVRGQEARLILPSDDQAPQQGGLAELVVVAPRPIRVGPQTYRYLVLYADKEHIEVIARTLAFDAPSPTGPR